MMMMMMMMMFINVISHARNFYRTIDRLDAGSGKQSVKVVGVLIADAVLETTENISI